MSILDSPPARLNWPERASWKPQGYICCVVAGQAERDVACTIPKTATSGHDVWPTGDAVHARSLRRDTANFCRRRFFLDDTRAKGALRRSGSSARNTPLVIVEPDSLDGVEMLKQLRQCQRRQNGGVLLARQAEGALPELLRFIFGLGLCGTFRGASMRSSAKR